MWLMLADVSRKKGAPMMWGYGWFGFLWMVLLWVGAILLVAWAIRRPDEYTKRSGSRALEILEERFARGEVSADEFQTRRRELAR